MLSARGPVRTVLLALVLAVVAGALVGVAAPLTVARTAAPAHAATTYGAPSWWNGDCDTVNWTAKARAAGYTGPAASRLGGVVLGIPVCGPRNLAGAPNFWWSRPGWGELEWQCVEYAQRFMIQVYGVEPYQANGVDVVNHYTTAQGGGLVKITNGTAGVPPKPGDVMSFSSPTNSAGHVAVVASTTIDGNGNGSILLATQNDTADGWRTLSVSNWKVASFGSLYPYGWLHDPLNRGNGGVDPSTTVHDGSYVDYGGVAYRVAGGAPVVITSWATMGGMPSGRIYLDAKGWAALRTIPRDGTFLRDVTGSGKRWRVVGGMPVPVTNCDAAGLGGCPDSVDIDPAAVARVGEGGTFGHLRTTIADGTFVRVGDDGAPGTGTIGRAAGGALLPVTDCDAIGGCGDWVNVQASAWAGYRSAHPTPVDGTSVRLQPTGWYATFAGGRCTVVDRAPSVWVDVPDSAVPCLRSAPTHATPVTTTVGLPIAVATIALPPLRVGTPAGVALVATGGSGRYTWTTVGAAPAGLTLAPDGRLAGTPTTAGTSTLQVRATDAATPSSGATKRFSVVVAAR